MMLGRRIVLLCVLGGAAACRPSHAPETTASATAETQPEDSVLTLDALVSLAVEFEPPPDISLEDLPSAAALQAASTSPIFSLDLGPMGPWWSHEGMCPATPFVQGACSHTVYDADNAVVRQHRFAYGNESGGPSVTYTYEPGGELKLVEACRRDGAGRVIRRQEQFRREGEPCVGWRVKTEHMAFDTRGSLVSVEESVAEYLAVNRGRPSHPERGITVFVPEYEADQLSRLAVYEGQTRDDAKLDSVKVYRWAQGELSRVDRFGRSGAWKSSAVYTRSGDLWRLDRLDSAFLSAGLGDADRVYEELESGEYVEVYNDGREAYRVERTRDEGLLVESKIVDGVVIERRTFEVESSERRPLLVEKLVDGGKLEVTERWTWGEGEVVREVPGTRRDVFVTTCADEPMVPDECPLAFSPTGDLPLAVVPDE